MLDEIITLKYNENKKGGLMKMNNSAIGSTWEELEQRLFTSEEIAASNLRVALIGELIKARQEKGSEEP